VANGDTSATGKTGTVDYKDVLL